MQVCVNGALNYLIDILAPTQTRYRYEAYSCLQELGTGMGALSYLQELGTGMGALSYLQE